MKTAYAALAASAVLAACASSSGPKPFVPPTPRQSPPLNTSYEEDPVRKRARAHTELAAGYFELRNMPVALEEVQIALKADPQYGPAHNVAGLIYAELRKDDLAQQHFQRALSIDARDPDANNNYGRFLCDRQREAEALKYFLAALSNPLYQTPERSYVNAGLCSRRRGDGAAAEQYFLRALKARPTEPQALYQLADMSYQRRDYAQAKHYLTRLEQLAAPSAEVLWLALRIERRLGERNAAAAYGQQLRRQFPNSREARAFDAGNEE
ncbi:MAG TPA: type IV pilus biogenesis/stability protein PilW [Burkholderiales bacterium]|nr:type IV pilus biogenesis/stability protein PilW [Burkholderiales bacterium]